MRKNLPLLILLVAALAGAYLLLRPSAARGPRPDDPSDDRPAAERAAPAALDASPTPASRGPREPTRIVDEGANEPPPAPGDGPALTGLVLDAETGKPIAGARVAPEPAAEPCPRALRRPHPFIEGDVATYRSSTGERYSGFGNPIGTTDAEGAFHIPWDAGRPADLFVKATGHVVASACSATTAAPVTVRLERGLSIVGVVVSRDDRPIAGARVWTAAAGAAAGLGHDEASTTNAEGRFTISGLVAGSVFVGADAGPDWMAASTGPLEPGPNSVRIVLTPAFVVSFEFKTDDGRAPETPTVAWTTTGTPPKTGLQLLRRIPVSITSDSGSVTTTDESGPWDPVRIPTDRPTVRFEVKALGYSTWSGEAIEIPAEGGRTTLPVELKRDPNLGRLIVHVEERDGGRVLSYVDEKIEPSIWRRDGQVVSAGIVLKPAETLELPALPAGPYGLLLRSPGHAPSLLEKVDVVAGRDTEVHAILGPPAKVRVRFTAAERTMVRFRLTQGRETAIPFPELAAGQAAREATPGATDGTLDAGPDGVLLSGLATGRYTIEVISPDLTATPTAVDLVEGDTKDVEISVSKR